MSITVFLLLQTYQLLFHPSYPLMLITSSISLHVYSITRGVYQCFHSSRIHLLSCHCDHFTQFILLQLNHYMTFTMFYHCVENTSFLSSRYLSAIKLLQAAAYLPLFPLFSYIWLHPYHSFPALHTYNWFLIKAFLLQHVYQRFL